MTTGTELTKRALEMLGADSPLAPANIESITRGRAVLMSMLEMWLTDNIVLGFSPIDKNGEELNEPTDTTNGIVSNLAIIMEPMFPGISDPGLARLAAKQKRDIERSYRSLTIPKKVVSSTLPRGAGNRHRNFGGRGDEFFPEGSTLGN